MQKRKDYGYTPGSCGNCGQSYTRANSLRDHYNTKHIRKDNKQILNPCYNADIRLGARSKNEAETVTKYHDRMENFLAKNPDFGSL